MKASEFKEQFLPLSRRMYWTAWRLTGHAQEAEDLVQDAYLQLWTKRDQLGEIENSEAYCIALVRNIYLNHIRRKRVDISEQPSERLLVTDETSIEEKVALEDESQEVQRLIGLLPVQQRRIITLHDVEDLSNEEIRQQTGLQPTHIRVLLSRARKAIREMITTKGRR